jgi:hypothetical protein
VNELLLLLPYLDVFILKHTRLHYVNFIL